MDWRSEIVSQKTPNWWQRPGHTIFYRVSLQWWLLGECSNFNITIHVWLIYVYISVFSKFVTAVWRQWHSCHKLWNNTLWKPERKTSEEKSQSCRCPRVPKPGPKLQEPPLLQNLPVPDWPRQSTWTPFLSSLAREAKYIIIIISVFIPIHILVSKSISIIYVTYSSVSKFVSEQHWLALKGRNSSCL